MSRKELTLMRRGYRAGYAAAFRKCHADLDALVATFRDTLPLTQCFAIG
jgi:hypothetical protein